MCPPPSLIATLCVWLGGGSASVCWHGHKVHASCAQQGARRRMARDCMQPAGMLTTRGDVAPDVLCACSWLRTQK